MSKSRTIWNVENTIELINFFKNNRVLWDQDDINYKNRVAKHKILEDVAKVFKTTVFDIKRKWQGLIMQYRRDQRKCKQGLIKPKVMWFGYEHLLFLGIRSVRKPSGKISKSRRKVAKSSNTISINNLEEKFDNISKRKTAKSRNINDTEIAVNNLEEELLIKKHKINLRNSNIKPNYRLSANTQRNSIEDPQQNEGYLNIETSNLIQISKPSRVETQNLIVHKPKPYRIKSSCNLIGQHPKQPFRDGTCNVIKQQPKSCRVQTSCKLIGQQPCRDGTRNIIKEQPFRDETHNKKQPCRDGTRNVIQEQPFRDETRNINQEPQKPYRDEWNIFAENVEYRLRKLKDRKHSYIIRHNIEKMLYEAELNELQQAEEATTTECSLNNCRSDDINNGFDDINIIYDSDSEVDEIISIKNENIE